MTSVLFRAPAPPPGGLVVPRKHYGQFKKCQAIRNRYTDGMPLADGDHEVIMAALRRHPKAARKIGNGVAAIVVGEYVNGTRCFFVIRVDGSVEDFSLRACFSPSDLDRGRPGSLLALMRAFDYRAITRKFQAALRSAA
jgi:hypothetical protein